MQTTPKKTNNKTAEKTRDEFVAIVSEQNKRNKEIRSREKINTKSREHTPLCCEKHTKS
jgi:hypothetical protein